MSGQPGWRCVIVLACLAACTQSVPVLELLESNDAGDAGVSRPFGTPLARMQGSDPFLSEDELTLYFSDDGALMVARRTSRDAPFAQAAEIPELANAQPDTDPSLFDQGRGMIFTSYRSGDSELYETHRDTTAPGSPWSTPVRLSTVGASGPDCCGHVDDAGTTLLFSSYREGRANIYRSERATPGAPWSAPVRVDELSRADADDFPSHWRGDVLVLDSTRLGSGRDILIGAYGAQIFGEPEPLPSVNGPGSDRNGWLSADGNRLYFQSDRDGIERIYMAER